VLADLGHTAQFLGSRGLALSNEARTLCLDCVLDNYVAALSLLERHAEGDYSPDELLATFPKFNGGPRRAAPRQLDRAPAKRVDPVARRRQRRLHWLCPTSSAQL
jgi:hypothetical protein